MSHHAAYDLPPTFKALQFTSSIDPPSVVDLPTPLPSAGTVILRVLYSDIVSFANEIVRNGNPRKYTYPLPFVPGTNSICRVAASAPDTPHLRPGALVWVSGVLRPRDRANAQPALHGLHMGFTPEGHALMEGEWRNGSWAQLLKAPAENVHELDEHALTTGLGYAIEDLGGLSRMAVAYGGLRDVGLRAGETVIVAPATGGFGSAAVAVALAMGAGKVVAMGRNRAKLDKVVAASGDRDRVSAVVISGDVQADTVALQAHGPIAAYFDISPPGAERSSHIQAGIAALQRGGRISFMGGIQGNVEIPYPMIMFNGLTLKGTFMYTKTQIDELIRLVETGLLAIGGKAGVTTTGKYSLDQWEEALDFAAREAGPNAATYFVPNGE